MKSGEMLDEVYDKLDFKHGQLFDAMEQPSKDLDINTWLNKGGWLTAAEKAGAEKVFFVDNNPIVIFAKYTGNEEEKNRCFNRLWSLARPRILFLEGEGELSVIDLAQKPVHQIDKDKKVNSLETLNKIQEVAAMLQTYHRDNIESGKVFEKGRFGDLKHRADQSLISDLKTIRNELIAAGLKGDNLQYAHALIGRSIFIRYLEDRGFLTDTDFEKVARQKTEWAQLLNNPTSREAFDFSKTNARYRYPRVLQDQEFTYAFFRSLSKDFNGDMFPNVDREEKIVNQEHLDLIQELLYGDVGVLKKLFFFSYQFDIIPLDLISSIYEEFYHASTDTVDKKISARQDGAFYTPSVLAEFVLSRVLTVKELKKKPTILDPACGSGIFLVEAFRRMVRYSWQQKNEPLSFNELKGILGKQIFGIELNDEAARITAFSLYLAMLHYLDPPSIHEQIRNGNKLPNLLVSEEKSKNHYHSIQVDNAFSVEKGTFGEVDIVVGNPPWGAPIKPDAVTRTRYKVMLDWCESNSYPIGDKESSQAFLWRSLGFLKKGGSCALLTSHGVLFNHGTKTQAFRKKWMNHVCLKEVFNFSHVREFFFQGADSPFAMIHFKKAKQSKHPVEYWSAKQVVALKETQAILLSKYDRSFLSNADLTDNKTWKVNFFGRQADALFIKQLGNLDKLEDYVARDKSGQGISQNPPKNATDGLPSKILNIKSFSCYENSLIFTPTPSFVYRIGKSTPYFKNRLLIKRGITQKQGVKGKIISRFETNDFCYTNAINGLTLKNESENHYKLILGILWSSFCRYYFFNIAANWGVWHYEIHLDDELLQLPIPTSNNRKKIKRIISIVDKLRGYQPQEYSTRSIPRNEIEAQRCVWEAELDEAVFDLYEFSEDQRDLIRDCCDITLPFFYQPYESIGVTPAVKDRDSSWLQTYAEIFARRWQPYLNEDEVMRADIHLGASNNLIAFEFYPADKGDSWDLAPKDSPWEYILDEIGKALPKPMGTSQIVLEGIVHAISDDSIIIIKRNEKRFWTRSIAREDATSTLCKRMLETMPHDGGIE